MLFSYIYTLYLTINMDFEGMMSSGYSIISTISKYCSISGFIILIVLVFYP